MLLTLQSNCTIVPLFGATMLTNKKNAALERQDHARKHGGDIDNELVNYHYMNICAIGGIFDNALLRSTA